MPISDRVAVWCIAATVSSQVDEVPQPLQGLNESDAGPTVNIGGTVAVHHGVNHLTARVQKLDRRPAVAQVKRAVQGR